MINLTILALSSSSIFSLSPMFVGKNTEVDKTTMKYFFSTIFYNPNQFHLSNSVFSHGFGALLYYDGRIPLNNETLKIQNETFNRIDQKIQPSISCLCTIIGCHFRNIEIQEKVSFINIIKGSSFYMTNCVFEKCDVTKQSFIYLETNASSISHICGSNIIGRYRDNSEDNGKRVFLYSKTGLNSFFKFVFSTLFGNDEDTKSYGIITFNGWCALRIQCINISHFKLSKYQDNEGNINTMEIEAPACLTMQMNTFADISSVNTLRLNAQDGQASYAHFVGLSNFIRNDVIDSVITTSLNSGTRALISNCYFIKNNAQKYLKKTDSATIIIENCVYDEDKGLDGEVKNCTKIPNILPHELNHFVTEEVCRGKEVKEAYGCQNGTCPDAAGCKEDAFSFRPDDFVYDEIHHTDIDTPTPSPTEEFSQSIGFTNTALFSQSRSFTDSKHFTFSDKFSRSSFFTFTRGFSKTDAFSQTKKFSMSSAFNSSELFSESNKFSSSFYFSKTKAFSETKGFSKTTAFSVSTFFTQSNDFSDSNDFSESNKFSSSFYFSKTGDFSETAKFTKTAMFSDSTFFTKSNAFSDSNDFSESKDFSNTFYFTKSRYFSGTLQFSSSIDFTDSITFTKSSLFTKSDLFTPSDDWNRTHTFSPSKPFSKSNQFSVSMFFTKSNDFTETDEFTKTIFFSYSAYFTESKDFSNSNMFSQSNQFKSSSYFTKSDCFTKTDAFSSSLIFSITSHFTQSDKFTDSKAFSESTMLSSETLNSVKPVNIYIKGENDKKSSSSLKIGVGVGVGALALLAIIAVGLIFLRKRKFKPVEDLNDDIEIVTDSANTVITQNPLMTIMNEDDPFGDEFDF